MCSHFISPPPLPFSPATAQRNKKFTMKPNQTSKIYSTLTLTNLIPQRFICWVTLRTVWGENYNQDLQWLLMIASIVWLIYGWKLTILGRVQKVFIFYHCHPKDHAWLWKYLKPCKTSLLEATSNDPCSTTISFRGWELPQSRAWILT